MNIFICATDDESQQKDWVSASDYKWCLWEIQQNVRSLWKHGEPKNDCKDIYEAYGDLVNDIYEMINREISDRNIGFD